VERGDLHVYSDPERLAAGLAQLVVDAGQTAIADRGTFSLVLSGGTTPRAAYELLARRPHRNALAWSDVYVYFGDERCVPPDDPRSNYRMAMETFLDVVPIPPHNVHRMRGEIDPATAAREYAGMLRDDLGDDPRFDLVLLGLGPDGHTASLFPGTPPMTDADALVRAVASPLDVHDRITLTPKPINGGRTIAFAVEGETKAGIVRAVRDGPHDPTKYPAQIVAPSDGRLLWLLDVLAAGQTDPND
jgi:6-phosphogluconolactonase